MTTESGLKNIIKDSSKQVLKKQMPFYYKLILIPDKSNSNLLVFTIEYLAVLSNIQIIAYPRILVPNSTLQNDDNFVISLSTWPLSLMAYYSAEC